MPNKNSQFQKHISLWIPWELGIKLRVYADMFFFGNLSDVVRHFIQAGIHAAEASMPPDKLADYQRYCELNDKRREVEKAMQDEE